LTKEGQTQFCALVLCLSSYALVSALISNRPKAVSHAKNAGTPHSLEEKSGIGLKAMGATTSYPRWLAKLELLPCLDGLVQLLDAFDILACVTSLFQPLSSRTVTTSRMVGRRALSSLTDIPSYEALPASSALHKRPNHPMIDERCSLTISHGEKLLAMTR
jgi:hypothetical protein